MATVKERVKSLIDELPEGAAAEVERMLLFRPAETEENAWAEFSTAKFANWFTEDEYVYPEDAGSPG